MATHSSVLAWTVPGTREPGGLPSMGSHRVRHDWSDLAVAGLQHARLPCPSPSPRACLIHVHWVGDAIQLSHPFLPPSPLPSIFPSTKVFSNELALCIRWPQDWSFSFSISPSNEYSGLTSFRIGWFDLLAVVQETLESSPAPQFKSISSSELSFLYGPTLTSIHDYWKNHSFD